MNNIFLTRIHEKEWKKFKRMDGRKKLLLFHRWKYFFLYLILEILYEFVFLIFWASTPHQNLAIFRKFISFKVKRNENPNHSHIPKRKNVWNAYVSQDRIKKNNTVAHKCASLNRKIHIDIMWAHMQLYWIECPN